MGIIELFAEIGDAFDFFRTTMGYLPGEIKLVFFYMFGVLMFFGTYWMFKR